MRFNIYDENKKLIGQDYQRENGEWSHKWTRGENREFERGSWKFRADPDNLKKWTYEEVKDQLAN